MRIYAEHDFGLRSNEIIKHSYFEQFLQDHIQKKVKIFHLNFNFYTYKQNLIILQGKPVVLSAKELRDTITEYHNNYLLLLLIENTKSSSEKVLTLNDEASENCLFNHNINQEVKIKSLKRKIAVVQAKNTKKSWKVRLQVTD